MPIKNTRTFQELVMQVTSAKITTELKSHSEPNPKMNLFSTKCLSKNKVRISMETVWNSWRRSEDKSKHEKSIYLFIYFLFVLTSAPSEPRVVILMSAFKTPKELRTFDRSEEGTKYRGSAREMYSVISASAPPSPSW